MIYKKPGKYLRLLLVTSYVFLALPGPRYATGQEIEEPKIPKREMRMSLMECIETSLKNNTDIIVERLNVMIADNDLINAKSDFDVSVNADVNFQKLENPSGSQLAGADVQEQETVSWTVGTSKRIITGGILQLAFKSERQETNSTWASLNPQYSTNLTLSFSQPLLKNFGPMTSKLRITLAVINRELSSYKLESTVLETASRVEEAYWNLVNAIEALEVQRQNLGLAEDLLEQARARVRVGVAPPISTLQAESTVAMRQESVIVAENSVNTAHNNLKITMNVALGSQIWDIVIIPSDRPSPDIKRPALEEMYKEALKSNLNMKQLRTNLKSQKRTTRVYKRLLWPRLDLIASAGFAGLAGDSGGPQNQTFQTGRVIPDPTGTSLGILETRTIQGPPNAFDGDYGDSVETLFTGDYFSYSAGLKFEMPIGNRAAKSTYKKALLEQKRLEAEMARTEMTIAFVLKNRVGDVESNLKRVKAAKVAAKLARQNMEAEQKRYKLGLVTQHDVLESQQDYAEARTNEIKALIDYNISVSKLERARAGYLDLGAGGGGGGQPPPAIAPGPEPAQAGPDQTGSLEPDSPF